MTLLDSLLDAIVRLDGDALVMHVGEKPYVVTTSSAMHAYRGPLAWGQVELSSRVLTPDAVLSMVGQILPADQRHALEEVGAVEHDIVSPPGVVDRFSVVAARGGDDIWLELRRHPVAPTRAAEAEPSVAAAGAEREEIASPPSGLASAVGIQEVPAPTPDLPTSPTLEADQKQPPAEAAEVGEISSHGDRGEGSEAESVLEAAAPSMSGVPAEAPRPPEPPEGRRPEDRIEERVPVLDEVTRDEAEHLEHFIIAVDGTGHPETDRRDADAAMELIEPEPQYAPTEEDVDAMLAATAASLLAANLKSEPPDAGTATEREAREDFTPDSFEVVIEEFEAEADLTSALDEMPERPWSADPGPPQAVPVQTPASPGFETDHADAAGVQQVDESQTAATAASETEPLMAGPEPQVREQRVTADQTREPQVTEQQHVELKHGAPPAGEAHGERVAGSAPPPVREAQGVAGMPAEEPEPPVVPESSVGRESVGPQQPMEAAPPAPVPPSQDILEFVPREPIDDAIEEEAGESPGLETETFLDTQVLPVPQGGAPSSAPPIGSASAQDASRESIVPSDRSEGRETESKTDEERLLNILRVAAQRGASTVYVVAQSKPMLRVDGDISTLDDEAVLRAVEVERLVVALAPERTTGASIDAGLEWISEVPQVGRVRSVTFRDHRGPGLILRLTSAASISAEHLHLSPAVRELCTLADGLVLVAGARGSGKSTLVNSFVDLINRTRSEHVVTLETEIGFVHESRRSFVSQRETPESGAAAAVSSALRENPDVLVIEDVQSPDVAAAALHAAESGRLVFASIGAPSSAAAIEAFLNLIPAPQRSAARAGLAGAMRAVVTQLLLPKASGGRLTARELLLNSPAVSASIRSGDANGITAGLDAGGRYGMVSLTEAIAALVRSGTVHAAEAYRRAPDRQALLAALARDGVDTSFAERFA